MAKKKYAVVMFTDDSTPNRSCIGLFGSLKAAVEAIADLDDELDDEDRAELIDDIKESFLNEEDYDDGDGNVFALMPLNGDWF